MKIGRSDILYLGSAFLTLAAVLTFVSGESALSPVTKIGVMAMIFTLLLGVGVFVERKFHQILAFGLSAITYVVGTAYTLSKFGLGSDTGFLVFIVSAAIFTGLGQLLTRQEIKPDRNQLKLTAVVLLAVCLSITLFDLSGEKPSYNLNVQDEVDLNTSNTVEVGKLIIQNNFLLPREVDQPNYRACLYPDTDVRVRVNVDSSYGTELIAGGGIKEKPVELSVIHSYNEEQEEPEPLGTFKIERADQCPDSSDEKKIVIAAEEGLY